MEEKGIQSNAMRLLWAGFMAILAAGIGFGVRGGILADWGAEFGFTGAQLGDIGGAGLQGFCFKYFIGGIIVDKIGYGKLVGRSLCFSHYLRFRHLWGDGRAVAGHGFSIPLLGNVPVCRCERNP
ncbi:MAG: hypothetical protein R3F11_28900 [Verrucomicrobiales bacterium]